MLTIIMLIKNFNYLFHNYEIYTHEKKIELILVFFSQLWLLIKIIYPLDIRTIMVKKSATYTTAVILIFLGYLNQNCSCLKCYSCTYSLITESLKIEDYFCANETLVIIDSDRTVRPCAPWEEYCVVNDQFYLSLFLCLNF